MLARLFNADGTEIHRTTVSYPPPPSFAWVPPRTPHFHLAASIEINTNPPMIEPIMFDRIGVEVDMSGTWVRYEERT